MKLYKILSTAALGMGLGLTLASCVDDNDSNPVLHMPESFTLNTPALAGNAYDLKNTTDSIAFTWSQPDYGGMPLVTNYKLQYVVSKDGSEVVTDADGKLKFADNAEVKEYDEGKTKCEYKLAPADVDLLLLRELGVKRADAVPSSSRAIAMTRILVTAQCRGQVTCQQVAHLSCVARSLIIGLHK